MKNYIVAIIKAGALSINDGVLFAVK